MNALQKIRGALLHAREVSSEHSDTFGNSDLCAWRYVPGVFRFQTRRPDLAKKLAQRSGASLVTWSVNGDYLRIYQETMPRRQAIKLVERYLKAANDGFFTRISRRTRRNRLGVSAQPEVPNARK